jgi:hypothetical protein
VIEVIDQSVNFSLNLLFFECQLDFLDLLVLIVKLRLHGLAVFALSYDIEVRIFVSVAFVSIVLLLYLFIFDSIIYFLLQLWLFSLFVFLTTLLGLGSVKLSLLFSLPVLLDFFVSNVEELVGVFQLVVDLGQDKILRGTQLSIDLAESLVKGRYLADNLLLTAF